MAEIPTSVANRCLSLDWYRIDGLIPEHICGLIWIYIVCSSKDQRAWDLLYDIIFLDPVTTRLVSQFQLLWLHRRCRCLPFPGWWVAFHSYIGQMFDKTCDQMNNWRWVNPRAFGDQPDSFIFQTTISGKFNHTGECFSWYGSDDHRAMFEPPSCRQCKRGDLLAVRLLDWDVIIN